MKFKPLGSQLLVLPQESKNFVTENNIEIVENEFSVGKVLEVSDEYANILPEGTLVVYAKESGKSQHYNGQFCLWIDARAPDRGGDCRFTISND